MKLQSKKYLADILFAIELIEDFISDISSFQEYSQNNKTKSAVERQLGIIGEAANKFTKIELEETLENVEQIISLRNRIIHTYDSIDDTIIWVILKNYLPPLKIEVLQKLN